MNKTRNNYIGKDYASVESVPGPRLRESGGGQEGRGGGRERLPILISKGPK